ncbi:putative cytochrome P450, partial [Phaeosphaeria sp. MPI-PUGE-AT-0046c]
AGHVVRVSPNELSFASAESWKDIYSIPVSGQKPFVKSDFYSMFGAGFKARCIGSERDPRKHRRIRGLLNSCFSYRTLLEQENILHPLMDNFVEAFQPSNAEKEKIMDMTAWYGMLGFDLMGEMSFGESFYAIQSGRPHFWTSLITNHLFFVMVADNLRRLPLIPTIAPYLVPAMRTLQNKHMAYTRDKVEKRLTGINARKDFLTTIVPKVHAGEMSKDELIANASTLILNIASIGGGDSVVSVFCGTTFHLLSPASHAKLAKVKQEVRSRFESYDAIRFSDAQHLPYLQAVIKEGMRIFPPGFGLPRISPGATISGTFVPQGTEVYTSPWPISRNPKYYHLPHSFEPERWLVQPDGSIGSPEFSSDVRTAGQPFLLGPHMCIGQNFAMMEMTLVLAKLVWRYDMELVDEEQYWPAECRSHLMWNKPPLMVRFK